MPAFLKQSPYQAFRISSFRQLARAAFEPVVRLIFLLLLLNTTLAPAAPVPDAAGLPSARTSHTATLLQDGKVLVAGGRQGDTVLGSVEMYDPATDAWTAAASLHITRRNHTATVLNNGKVLVAGGEHDGTALASAEIYDPASGTWAAAGSLGVARSGHTATLLPNGKVLIAGGEVSASAELYDPASNTSSATGSLTYARAGHSATLLPGGKVLVVGGPLNNAGLAELYDQVSGKWSTVDGSYANQFNASSSATLLSDGRVLVAGGVQLFGLTTAAASFYNPSTNTWSQAPALILQRSSHTATLLANGKVLVLGGVNASKFSFDVHASAELYDPVQGTWTPGGVLKTARWNHTATLLLNGKILVVGGENDRYEALASAELFDPAHQVGSLPVYRFFNEKAGGHFFTISESEKNAVIANYPWFRYEGIGFYAYAEQYAGTEPVYRFFNNNAGGHFFTINTVEKQAVTANLPWFHYEGTGFYAFPNQVGKTSPVYRFFNNNAGGHFFTVSESEKNAVVSNYPWFHLEGVGFYAGATAP